MTDFDALIPEMRDWNDGRGIDVETWIGCIGNCELAIGYSVIFWPRFVEFEDYILREGFSVKALREFERHEPNERRNVEAVMNHLHLIDIHHATKERLIYLGTVLREIYEAKLSWQFPLRHFEVCFINPGTDELSDYQITFFQKP